MPNMSGFKKRFLNFMVCLENQNYLGTSFVLSTSILGLCYSIGYRIDFFSGFFHDSKKKKNYLNNLQHYRKRNNEIKQTKS